MSLKLMTFVASANIFRDMTGQPNILMAEMLQQLELSVGAFGKDRGAEGLHNLLDRHCLASKLVLGRAGQQRRVSSVSRRRILHIPNKTERSHSNRLEVGVSISLSMLCSGDISGGGPTC